MDFSDFKTGGLMLTLALGVVAFVIVQSLFFIIKSWKHAKELGIPAATLKNTVVSSILFTIAPAVSILATVIVLADSLGIILPWIRLTVIGNLAYETTAAQTALEALGGSLTGEITDATEFATVSWAMTIGSIAPLILLPFLCKKLQKKIGNAVNKNEATAKLGDAVSAAAFIGIVMAFVSREIYSYTVQKSNVADANGNSIVNEAGEILKVRTISGSAGVMSILVLVCAVVFMLILEVICKKFKLTKLEPFTMPIAMFAAMGMAVLFTNVLPEEIVSRTWFEIGSELGQLYE